MRATVKRADLEAEIARLRNSEHALLCSLNDTIEGKVKWFRKGVYSFGVVRPTAADGGTVVMRFAPGGQSPYSTAHRWDDLWPQIRDNLTTDKDSQDWKDLGCQVHEYILTEQNREWKQAA